MKIKILYWQYNDRSAFDIIRAYFQRDFPQARKDRELFNNISHDRKFELVDIDMYGTENDSV